MTDLVEFIRARLDETERLTQSSKDVALKRTHYRAPMIESLDRELRDVEAKREILRRCGFILRHATGPVAQAEARAVEPVVRLLASVYNDHPDYRDEWRPTP